MQQVLINLLKNASESGSPAEEIGVELRAGVEDGTELWVVDRGKGMSEEVLRKRPLCPSTRPRSRQWPGPGPLPRDRRPPRRTPSPCTPRERRHRRPLLLPHGVGAELIGFARRHDGNPMK
jgi:hypothetical protein